jgi:diaminopimelate epimerase
MSGAGNDFVVLDGAVWESLSGDRAAWVRGICRRGLSVGADGVLVVAAAGSGRVRVDFFNPDGGAAFCGNGSRCAARYAALRGFAQGPAMILETAAGDVPATLDGKSVTLTLLPPQDRGELVLTAGGASYRGRLVEAGVPHFVLPVDGLASYPLLSVAPALRSHTLLGPSGANVNCVERDTAGRLHVRTFERGVENETLACGSGAVAVALAARLAGAPETVVVVPRSGLLLKVTIEGDPRQPIRAHLAGDARVVFEGVLDADGIPG